MMTGGVFVVVSMIMLAGVVIEVWPGVAAGLVVAAAILARAAIKQGEKR